MKKLIEKLKQKYELLKNDRILSMIFLLHLILAMCHLYHSFISPTRYHIYLRAGGCLLIAVLIFIFGRKGLSYGMTMYACALIYVNTFFNYGSIFFILVAIGANPKTKKQIMLLYLVNMVVSFSMQKLLVFSAAIHIVYIILFALCIRYVFKVNTPDKLNLTEDEKAILGELAKDKLQKEIDLFSQQTISQKLKNARERNMCDSTAELVSKFKDENNL